MHLFSWAISITQDPIYTFFTKLFRRHIRVFKNIFLICFFPPLRKVEPKFGSTFLKGKVEPKFGSTFLKGKVEPKFGSTFLKG